MKQYSIVPMASSHLPQLADIEAAISPHPWALRQFSESLKSQSCFTLFDHDTIIGYAVLAIICPGEQGEAELLNLGIHSDYQGKGLGSHLLQYCLAELAGLAQRIFLEVRVSNFAAIRLYSGLGFNEVATRRDYYQLTSGGREDAYIMAKELL